MTSLDVLAGAAFAVPPAAGVAVLLVRGRALRPAVGRMLAPAAAGAALLCAMVGQPERGTAAGVVAALGVLVSLTLVAALVAATGPRRDRHQGTLSASRPSLGDGLGTENDAGRRARRTVGGALAAGTVLAAADVTGRLGVLHGGDVPLTVLIPVGGVAWLGLMALLVGERPVTAADPRPGRIEAGAVLLLVGVTAGVLLARDVAGPAPVLGALALVALWAAERLGGRENARQVEHLAGLAATDDLTGLGNARALADAVARGLDDEKPLHLLSVDLDGFAEVNAGLGRDTGDAVLRAVADRLRIGPGEAFRMGGDEFAVLLVGSGREALDAADRMVEDLPAAALTVPGAAATPVAASIGIARHQPAGDLSRALADLQHSGEALRAAKAAGRGRVMTYGAPLAQRRVRRATVLAALRRKIDDGGVDLHFQPVVDLRTLRMTGAEALARWNDPELGWVPPDEFIRLAEENGLIDELGLQLLERSMAATVLTGMQSAGMLSGINVSALQLRTPGFVDRVAAMAHRHRIATRQYVVEITESVGMDDDDPAVRAVHGLAELGFPISIDDFGTGYSALALLSRLPVTFLKLDRGLTSVAGTPRGHTVARSVTDLAHGLGIEVVAEGIETTADLELMRRLGARHGQGWLFCRAVPAQELSEIVIDPRLPVARHSELIG